MSRRNRVFPNIVKTPKVVKLGKLAKDNSAALVSEARKGSAEAAIELYRIAALAISWLEYVNQLRPDLLAEFAQTKLSSPVMRGPDKQSLAEVSRALKALKLGAKTGLNISPSGKKFSRELPANRVTVHLV